MEIFTKAEFKHRYKEILQKIREGAVFICGTDTIYGISCNALLENSVAKIRQLKQRPDSPFSVWAPSVKWIKNSCEVKNKEVLDELKKLPGPYTLILALKNKTAVARNVLGNQQKTIGVRYPKHWFSAIVKELNVPLVTTSANKAGQPFMTYPKNLDLDIAAGAEFFLYEGPKEARPSKIVDLATGKVKER